MAVARFDFFRPCRCARRLRQLLERLPGVEDFQLDAQRLCICVEYNPVLVDSDTLAEVMVELGCSIRPAADQTASSGIQRKNALSM